MNISSTNIKPEPGFIRNILLLPSRLCIDAPLVAVSWSSAIEYSRNGFVAGAVPHLALFLAVWVIYLFDRLYDSRPGLTEQRPSLRHQFAQRNRRLLFSLLIAALTACVFIVLSGRIDFLLLKWGALLAAPVLLYFAVFRFFTAALRTTRIPMKEITIGLCFSTGVCLASGIIELGRFFPLGALFTLNCLIISRSEAGEDAHSDPAAFFSADGNTPLKNGKLPYWEFCIALVTVAIVWSPGNPLLFSTAVTLSTLLLTVISFGKQTPRHTQALADVSLLTAWPVLWISIYG